MQKENLAGPIDDMFIPAGRRLWRNGSFNIFWAGQTLSVVGDAFITIALPLLVLEATGSVAQMGIVTGIFGIGQVITGFFAGPLVDRLDRRKLMIFCDTLRMLLYLAIPLWWHFVGPQLWLIYVITALGACLGMIFQVAYITAVANLVDRDQLTEANGRLQATQAIAFVTGPIIAGLISGRFGPTTAISIDALSFGISALSLYFIHLRPAELAALPASEPGGRSQNFKQEFLAGISFLWRQPTLRAIAILLALLTILTSGTIDLFMFHLKHDLGQSDDIVGYVFGAASVGAIFSGLLASSIRRRFGFGVSWLGGFLVMSIALTLFSVSNNLWLIALFATCYSLGGSMASVVSVSLRQEITPDHLLGRVTSAFWTISLAPGPLGAAIFTALASYIGVSSVTLLTGGLCLLVVSSGFFLPVRQRHPERAASVFSTPQEKQTISP
ncbi:MFS transporter [Ktedonosporobacter rubrisoli]|uniref:MFS transporter n=1 Tax=Ktedonosporobacter rubrisoli TaxID=2509675 RepID=A0A4P6JJR6_KTERU|nr:MFS transporter [Ktedonosporobacter rubrisoli]QBD75374.1 MFS transporter [Ktedonosporobacter rubrisoli]